MKHCLSGTKHEHDTLLPVFAALESARFLRREIDNADTAEAHELAQLRHEIAMLRHWLQVAGTGETDYTALGEGLWTFADQVEQRLPAAPE